MQRRFFMLGLLLILLPTMACGFFNFFGGDDDEAEDSAPATIAELPEAPPTPAPSPTPAPVESQSAEPSPTPTEATTESSSAGAAPQQSTEGGDSVSFAGITNLENLSSYRISFILDFDGTSGGQPAQGHIEMILEATQNPVARHMAMTMEGSTVEELGGANQIEFYQVDDTVYLYNNAAGGQWISMSGGDSQAFTEGFFTPQEQLDLPETATCSDEIETVNGIDTNHCTFTEADISDTDASYGTAQGDVWVAVDGNYIVKFTMEGEVFEGTGQSNDMFDFGAVSYEYSLLSTNEDFTITLPEEAKNAESLDFDIGGSDSGGAASEFPIPDDAEDVFSVAGITSFYTTSSVADTIDFYRQELAPLGWTEDDSQAFISEDTAFLSFTKDSDSLTLTLNREDDGRVQVSLIPSGP